jgi:hypothetical protein
MIQLNIDLSPLTQLGQDLKPRLEKALQQAAANLAVQAHAHLLEQVQSQLNSTREKYVDAISFNQVNDSTWMIHLDQSAMWIEEGLPEHEMLDNLLKSSKAKIAKDGSKYLVVPFQHNKGPTQQTQAQGDLTNTVKAELKKRNIPYGKLERDDKGKAKTGLLHSFDITKDPIKTHEGAGQGHGPIGQVRQGTTGIPFLQSVRVYQRNVGGRTQRGIMTFRVASSKQRGTGKWVHPGLQPRNFLDETADWANQLWDTMREEISKDIADL